MRKLTDTELHVVLRKLAEYTGSSLKDVIALDNTLEAERHVFRISQQRVFHVRLSIANLATSVARDKLLSLGTCLGKHRRI
jgi:60S ribosome subunit biogenesis protein NIP7